MTIRSTDSLTREVENAYRVSSPWNSERPHILVVACSDGRLQQNLDEFLTSHLGITRYDRLYTPGGPGALTSHGMEFLRSDQFRRECNFLIQAHAIEEVILIFHGPSADGPAEATCADYSRVFPRLSPQEIRELQLSDAREIVATGFGHRRAELRISIFRCEATADGGVQFVRLPIA